MMYVTKSSDQAKLISRLDVTTYAVPFHGKIQSQRAINTLLQLKEEVKEKLMMTTPIRNLLIQQKIWRLVGFLSTLVGLLSFALSSSFKQLFGQWNLLKIFVYTVISSIICNMMLFVKKFQLSRRVLWQAHVGFLVFMLTSIYSFYAGQKITGKSDKCSLISSGAFALMSLSLSRQIDLGFEVDLFNFFLGCLMVQLMSIHWELAIVGAVFCYLLMYLNSHLDSQTQSETFNLAEHVTVEIDDANSVQVGAGSQCNQELIYTILGIEEKREDTVIFPTDMEARLREAIVAGFVDECYHIYFTWRRQILDPKLLKIGLHKLDIKEIKNVPLNYLEKKIQRWIMASNYVLRAQLPEERKLCNLVFSSYSLHADIAFMKISRGSMTQLLNFANAVATGTGSPERLFRILKVFEALRELLPEMESLFSDQYSVTLRDEAIAICEKLREAIKSVFKDLENMLCQDPPTRVTVPGGGLHPITHYIMNYLRAACQSLRTLEYVFENENLEMSLSSPLSFQVVRIMELLERYLEANSKMYQGPCLHFVFMMNNVRYIVQTAKHSELRQLLGELWIQKHIAQVRQYLVNYERSSWDQVLGMFKVDNDHVFVESFKQKLSLLILQFEGICKVQSTWVIFDERLREKIISSLKKILLPAYENFSARFQNVMETQEDTNIYSDLGFGIQDIVTGIDKLFQGRDELKKHRNMQPTWTIVLPINKDFYEWRKRGQDAFLNSSYPRDYYWCIHKFDQGCQATKQVQQIQENPTKFMTRYTGLHTCRMGANAPGMLTEANTHETFIVNHPDQ